MTDKCRKVLIVEDEKKIWEIFVTALTKHSHKVDIAENGRIGFQKATTFDYDIILFDLHMPEWNGVDAIKRILMVKPTCKFLVVTAYADSQMANELRDIPQVLAILSKPADIYEILSYVESA